MDDGRPALEDGRVLDVSSVIWCTGFREEFPWIDLPIFDENERPLHERGVVVGEPGLYFVGMPFQYAATSDVLPGVGRDASTSRSTSRGTLPRADRTTDRWSSRRPEHKVPGAP